MSSFSFQKAVYRAETVYILETKYSKYWNVTKSLDRRSFFGPGVTSPVKACRGNNFRPLASASRNYCNNVQWKNAGMCAATWDLSCEGDFSNVQSYAWVTAASFWEWDTIAVLGRTDLVEWDRQLLHSALWEIKSKHRPRTVSMTSEDCGKKVWSSVQQGEDTARCKECLKDVCPVIMDWSWQLGSR